MSQKIVQIRSLFEIRSLVGTYSPYQRSFLLNQFNKFFHRIFLSISFSHLCSLRNRVTWEFIRIVCYPNCLSPHCTIFPNVVLIPNSCSGVGWICVCSKHSSYKNVKSSLNKLVQHIITCSGKFSSYCKRIS